MCPNPNCPCHKSRGTPTVFRIRQADYIGNRTLLIRLMRGGKLKLCLSKKAWTKLLAEILSNAE